MHQAFYDTLSLEDSIEMHCKPALEELEGLKSRCMSSRRLFACIYCCLSTFVQLSTAKRFAIEVTSMVVVLLAYLLVPLCITQSNDFESVLL